MKNIFYSIILVFISFHSLAQIPDGYYDDAEGLSGSTLKTALYNIIKDHNAQSYTSLWTHFQSTDAKTNGYVWDMYSDVPGGTPPYNFTFIDDQCGNYSQEGDCYNREHSFPKSWFNNAAPMKTDLFHIVPTDGYVNGQRSNWPFGESNNPQWTSMNGSKRGSNSTPGYSGTVFEPIDEYKGDFARIYFYMATRYEDIIAGWENNSDNADVVLDGTAYPVYEEWILNLLLEWHTNDPVSQKEIDRNNAIYNIQSNRNPFVDHSEYVNMVWGGVQPPVISNISFSPQNPNENEVVSVTANITDDGSVANAILHWGFSSSNLLNDINMSSSGAVYSAQIPGQAAGQEVYFRIEASDNETNTSLSPIFNYQVNENAGSIALPFFEDFNEGTLGVFYQQSVEGPEQYWHHDDYEGTQYAKMSNYNGSENIANEDWLITPAINFDLYEDENLFFYSAMKDYNDNNTHIYLKYSTNYSGSGNPNNATWTDISNLAVWSSGDYNWLPSGSIDLSFISGTSVHIAIEYDSQAGSGKTWEIDDYSITVQTGGGNEPPVISNVDFQPSNPQADEEVLVSAQISDDNLVLSAVLMWGYSSSSIDNTIDILTNVK